MQSWLLDNFDLILIVLGIATLAFATAWWRTRKRMYAFGAGGALALVGLAWLMVFLLPRIFGESDSQQIERKVREMAAAVKDRNLDRIFSHISSQFNYHAQNREAFRRRADEVMRGRHVEEVVVWDFQRGDISRETREAKVSFMVKARGSWQGSEAGYPCETKFVLDPDGQWRMQSFEVFHPFVDSNQPLRIPGF